MDHGSKCKTQKANIPRRKYRKTTFEAWVVLDIDSLHKRPKAQSIKETIDKLYFM